MQHYFVFYKPFQVLSQFSPEGSKTTLKDALPFIPNDVYPAGRLDYDSEGLMVLTNDRQLIHRLLEPRFGHSRSYLVQVEGTVTPEAIAQLEQGVTITVDGKRYTTKEAKAEICSGTPAIPARFPPIRFRKNIPTSWLHLTITEGKNRQVRKMTAATGFPTLRLIRYSIGHITIDGMNPGDLKALSAKECKRLMQ